MMAAVILVFVLGIGGLGWRYYNSHSAGSASAATHEVQPQPAAPIQPATSSTETPAQQPPADSPTATTAPNTALDSAATTVAPLNNAVSNSTDSKLLASAPAIKQSVTADTSSQIVTPTEFTLDLRADEDTWAQVTADGKQVWKGVITKDSSQSYRAGKQLVVKLGNPSGVQLNYNGKPLPRFEKDSQSATRTRTLNFTPAGLASR
jgi:hypothetical protein